MVLLRHGFYLADGICRCFLMQSMLMVAVGLWALAPATTLSWPSNIWAMAIRETLCSCAGDTVPLWAGLGRQYLMPEISARYGMHMMLTW